MNTRINLQFTIIIIVIFSISGSLFGQTLTEKRATPQRSSFTTSAFTTYPGAFEIESGIGLSNNTFNTSITVKYGFGLQVEVFVGFVPYLIISNPQDYEGLPSTYLRTLTRGYGDTYIGARYRLWINFYEEKMFAIQLHSKVATARGYVWAPKSLGTGEPDYTGFLIYTIAKEKYQLDINLGLNLLGRDWASDPEPQAFGMFCLTKNLTKKFSIIGELYSFQQWDYYDAFLTENDDVPKDYKKDLAFIGLFGISYAVKPTLVFDVSANFGISNAPYDWQIMTGFTFTL